MSQNAWHLITLTADNTDDKVRIYLDGVEQGTAKDYDGTIATGAADLSIGRQIIDYFNGSIDSVRIYNRALSAEEVLREYNGGKGVYFR